MALYNSLPPYPIAGSVSEGLTATPGGTQATALGVVSRVNRVAVVATAGDAVRLPPFLTDGPCYVVNDSLNALSVYAYEPTSMIGSSVGGLAATVAPGKAAYFVGTGTYGKWLMIQSS